MKFSKKLLLVCIFCFSFLLISCDSSKSSEKTLTAYLNGAMQANAGFSYDYGDVSKIGSKEHYDSLMKDWKKSLYEKVFDDSTMNFDDQQKDKVYDALLKTLQSVKYQLKSDKIEDTTAQFTVTSNCIDSIALEKDLIDKGNLYASDEKNVGKNYEEIKNDLLNIIVESLSNAPCKEVSNTVFFEKKDNLWTITNEDDLGSFFFN